MSETTKAKQKLTRNSNVEILRLVAMLLIVLNHFPWPKIAIWGTILPYTQRFPLVLLTSFLSNFGGLGDCLFFGISTWFLCMEQPDFRKSIRRVWQLEKQLLFYSFLFLFCSFAASAAGMITLSKKLILVNIVKAFFPVLLTHWWYPASYILFLLLFPWINAFLIKMGKQLHKSLSLILLLFWGFIPFGADQISHGMSYSIVLFIYQYILLSYIVWYKKDFLKSKKNARNLLLAGFIIGVTTQFICEMLLCFANKNVLFTKGWLNCPSCIPSMFMGLGMLMLATQKTEIYNKVINRLASCTLAIYLLITDKNMNTIIAKVLSILFTGQSGYIIVLTCVIMALLIFIVSILLDLIRQGIFAITVNRRPYRWLYALENKGKQSKRLSSLFSTIKFPTSDSLL
ncbi:acyltransferase [Bifidobacterium sp. ESL0728]|uniref:acyltransferase family protein n=1 Tax=Bifidobacterium sp. ESL0728 TaxID=2983220 RepID=UPI0023F98FE6|nr:acyltransferase [Bifidobacterium sp. ESL0728]WEV59328.1 acyltransferase [Bifidobacterium sp. ESL0728]